MPHSYLGISAFKASITIVDTTDDARLRAVLEAVSEQIDNECGRTFRVYLATRYETARQSRRLLLTADLLAATSVDTDTGDRTYATALDPGDYDLTPDDALERLMPYTAIDSDGVFPRAVRRGVRIVGKWGFAEDLLRAVSLINVVGGISSSAVSIVVDSADEFDIGHTLLVDDEQMYVTGVNTSTETLTVERGVNGTIAAAHANDSPIDVYRYPGPIVEATRLQAARIFQRAHAPFGVTGSADFGTVVIPGAGLDRDVKGLIAPYRSMLGMVA